MMVAGGRSIGYSSDVKSKAGAQDSLLPGFVTHNTTYCMYSAIYEYGMSRVLVLMSISCAVGTCNYS